jgi:hypothetical protein
MLQGGFILNKVDKNLLFSVAGRKIMNEHQTQTPAQPADTIESLRVSRDMLIEEIKSYGKKFTQQAGVIISLESRIAILEKDLSSEIVRNALLSSENEELKHQIEMYVNAQKTFVRDLQRSQGTKWYKRVLGKR